MKKRWGRIHSSEGKKGNAGDNESRTRFTATSRWQAYDHDSTLENNCEAVHILRGVSVSTRPQPVPSLGSPYRFHDRAVRGS